MRANIEKYKLFSAVIFEYKIRYSRSVATYHELNNMNTHTCIYTHIHVRTLSSSSRSSSMVSDTIVGSSPKPDIMDASDYGKRKKKRWKKVTRKKKEEWNLKILLVRLILYRSEHRAVLGILKAHLMNSERQKLFWKIIFEYVNMIFLISRDLENVR